MDNALYHQFQDKKIGTVLEKLGLLETQLIDVKDDLTKKIER